MQLSPVEWTAVIGLLGLLLAVIAFFAKPWAKKPDKHEDDIHQIRLQFATKEEVSKDREDINTIKQTYVTKTELKELKAEMRGETKKLAEDVDEIKRNYLTRQDFLGVQAKTDRQLDKILDILLSMKGGHNDGT